MDQNKIKLVNKMKSKQNKTLKKYDVLNSVMFTNHYDKLDKWRGYKKQLIEVNDDELAKLRSSIYKETRDKTKEIRDIEIIHYYLIFYKPLISNELEKQSFKIGYLNNKPLIKENFEFCSATNCLNLDKIPSNITATAKSKLVSNLSAPSLDLKGNI